MSLYQTRTQSVSEYRSISVNAWIIVSLTIVVNVLWSACFGVRMKRAELRDSLIDISRDAMEIYQNLQPTLELSSFDLFLENIDTGRITGWACNGHSLSFSPI